MSKPQTTEKKNFTEYRKSANNSSEERTSHSRGPPSIGMRWTKVKYTYKSSRLVTVTTKAIHGRERRRQTRILSITGISGCSVRKILGHARRQGGKVGGLWIGDRHRPKHHATPQEIKDTLDIASFSMSIPDPLDGKGSHRSVWRYQVTCTSANLLSTPGVVERLFPPTPPRNPPTSLNTHRVQRLGRVS